MCSQTGQGQTETIEIPGEPAKPHCDHCMSPSLGSPFSPFNIAGLPHDRTDFPCRGSSPRSLRLRSLARRYREPLPAPDRSGSDPGTLVVTTTRAPGVSRAFTRSRISHASSPFHAAAVSSLAAAAYAHQYSVGNLVIGHPWSRPTASGMPTGVAYLSITNNGPQQDTLIAASTPAAAHVEFHRTSFEAGMARMRPAGRPGRRTQRHRHRRTGRPAPDAGRPEDRRWWRARPFRWCSVQVGRRVTVQLQVEPQGAASHR